MAETRVAYTVVKDAKDSTKEYWRRIGIAFDNPGGTTKIKFEALPVNGEVVLKKAPEARSASAELE